MANASAKFDVDAYWRAGKIPWTIFAFPSGLADSDRLPRDDDAKRFLAELLSRDLQVGIWSHPEIEHTIYFACPFEDRMIVRAAIEDLERQGKFPPGFLQLRTEHLFSLVVDNP